MRAIAAREERHGGYAVVEERRLVGNVDAVVDGQYPVAVLQHGKGDHCLARLALGVELGESEERQQHEHCHGDNRYERKVFLNVVHVYKVSTLY